MVKNKEKVKTKKQLEGIVTSNKMNKTVVVEVTESYIHPKYKKILKTKRRFKAHTDQQIAIGKKVVIEATKKLSKEKAFKVIKVIEV